MSETESPPPPATVTLTIDGREVTVPKGTNVLEAARSLGIEISAFCYHPGLSIAACCRQCLVKVEKAPKLQPSCQQVAGDGMVVSTVDPEAVDARRQQLEFTLLNHPIDCPICDKAGECTLQKLYFDHDGKYSRADVVKVRKAKVVDLGPTIVLDQERCILCTRCIRVCDEVAHHHQLDMSYRGDKERLGCAPGEQLDNPYSLNTVDVCPVGALTSKDFRFSLRAWELYTTPTVCNGCATGCNIEIHHNEGRIYRLVPRHNPEVNDYWMCDEGRFTYRQVHDKRLAGCVVDGLPAPWQRAVDAAWAKLDAVLSADRDAVGVVYSAEHTNEALYALHQLATAHWQLERGYLVGAPPRPDRADDILRDADVNPNRSGATAILGKHVAAAGAGVLEQDLMAGELKALIVLGRELSLSDEALAKLSSLDALIVIADREVGVAARADIALACASWAETHGTITNRHGKVQRMRAAFPPAGNAVPAWEAVVRLARASGATLSYAHPREVFRELVANVPAFASAEWGREAPIVQLRFAGSRG